MAQGPDDCAHYGASKAEVQVTNVDGTEFLKCTFCYCITCDSIILGPDKDVANVVVELEESEYAVRYIKTKMQSPQQVVEALGLPWSDPRSNPLADVHAVAKRASEA